eukprot:TRINITY_DN92588_c0_g1_i1.p1 TRINITY_DN92588_c0_g1~~TRINITY_DN92588_c0_g1_i1.p1  ORF type:complete len:343 (-),score=46.44 TRINITY_DN92588_c0_g1_i1:282-1310(-)
MGDQRRYLLALLALTLVTALWVQTRAAFSAPQVPQVRSLRGLRSESLVTRAVEEVAAKVSESDADKAGDGSLESGYNLAGWGTALLAAPQLYAAGKGNFVALQEFQLLVVVLIVVKVMRSAAARNRLNGTTFKQLNMALIGTFATLFCISLHVLAGLATAAVRSGCSCILCVQALFGLLLLGTSKVMVSTAYKGLEKHGLPAFRSTIVAKEGPAFSALAVAYAITALHAVWFGSAQALYSGFKAVGLIRCFMVAACAYECQKAAVAGRTGCSALGGESKPTTPRRLSSETYRLLNIALMVDSACRLYPLYMAGAGLAAFAFPGLALAASSLGWLAGKLSVGK